MTDLDLALRGLRLRFFFSLIIVVCFILLRVGFINLWLVFRRFLASSNELFSDQAFPPLKIVYGLLDNTQVLGGIRTRGQLVVRFETLGHACLPI